MLTYPHINNIAIKIGPIKVYWYGLMYLLGIICAIMLGKIKAKQLHLDWTNEQIIDLVFYCALGVIVGGRIGYVLFYATGTLISDPLFIFRIWQGGMAFHGGIIGVLIAVYLFARRMHLPYFTVGDFLAPLVPLALFAGRIGNFINAELPGRVTTMPWGMVFPYSGALPRHPSQLYEALFEGIVLFLILWIYSSKPRPRCSVSALFLIGYSVFRFCCEFFREPDMQLGFVAFDWLTMGQLLSIPLFIGGVVLLLVSLKNIVYPCK
jgi:phosphatidylglycerol---prolipoprotein diacylglyceryl transferase